MIQNVWPPAIQRFAMDNHIWIGSRSSNWPWLSGRKVPLFSREYHHFQSVSDTLWSTNIAIEHGPAEIASCCPNINMVLMCWSFEFLVLDTFTRVSSFLLKIARNISAMPPGPPFNEPRPRWRGKVQAAARGRAETRPRGDAGLRGTAGAVLHSPAVAWTWWEPWMGLWWMEPWEVSIHWGVIWVYDVWWCLMMFDDGWWCLMMFYWDSYVPDNHV